MAKTDPLRQVPCLFHFTDRRNLPLIQKLGVLFPHAELRNRGIEVPAPGGNQWSLDADQMKGMDTYVHLCFCGTHPMEYRARQDGRITDSIFLQIHPAVLEFDGVRYSPEVSNKAGAEFFTIDEARERIDFQVLYTWMDWRDPPIKERRNQAEKAEILVPRHIPLHLIRNIPNG